MLHIARRAVSHTFRPPRPLLCLTNSQPFTSSPTHFKTDNPLPSNGPKPTSPVSPVSRTNSVPSIAKGLPGNTLQESLPAGESARSLQSPNREKPWSRSQQPRERAMVGPRFEQTAMEEQPRPLAAIELIHKQPVQWVASRVVACDGGGGPLGHPRIFINVDKPQICVCTYCGLPYAHKKHRKYIEALEHKAYPLDPVRSEEEEPESQDATSTA